MKKYETLEPCILHKTHSPHPTYQELHHVVPQAWQAIFQPPNFDKHLGPQNDVVKQAFPFWGLSPDRIGLYLWDARTDAICRTGHGNVHHWLVQIMHEMQARNTDLNAAIFQVLADARKAKVPCSSQDFMKAQQAILRFLPAGGDLATLWAAGEWGEI